MNKNIADLNIVETPSRRLFYIIPTDWVWWAWTITTVLLAIGLAGHRWALIAAMAVTAGQGLAVWVRDRSIRAYSVQLRAAYLFLMLIGYLPPMRWMYWLLAAGTFALIIFGYCTLTRILALMPWNSREPITLDRLRRTFLSAPDLGRAAVGSNAGGLCTIAAQVAPRRT